MIQTLNLPSELCEFKFAEDGNKIGRFEGYASVYNSVDQIGDTVLPGAYKSTIETKGAPGVFMRYEHLRHTSPGKWTHMEEDSKGLLVVGELTPGHTLASDIRASFKHGTVGGLSIGWIPSNSKIQKKAGGRILESVDVFEISITHNPMEAGAEVTSFKSEIESIETLKEAEHFLRESGICSKSMATLFIGHVKSIIQRESEKLTRDEIDELKSKLNASTTATQYAKLIKGL